MPISKHSTLNEMKEYVRKNKLNKSSSIKLGMKKSVMLGELDKLGHIHTGARGSDKKSPQKKTPKSNTPPLPPYRSPPKAPILTKYKNSKYFK